MEKLPVKEPGSAGEGGSNCPGGKQHGFPAAFQEVLFYKLAETETCQGNEQQEQGNQSQFNAEGNSHNII
jgi:hypothetical protein